MNFLIHISSQRDTCFLDLKFLFTNILYFFNISAVNAHILIIYLDI